MRACVVLNPKHVKTMGMMLHGWVCVDELSRYIMNGM
jgi:hypothetical protein